MAKFLVVNADDFGYSPGVNRGIVEFSRRGAFELKENEIYLLVRREVRGVVVCIDFAFDLTEETKNQL